MARLENWDALTVRSRARLSRVVADPRVDVQTSNDTHLTYMVDADGLLVDLTFVGDLLKQATIKVGTKPGTPGIQRFNRLLDTLQGELVWYHRTKQVHYHLPGQWLDLPVEVRWSPDGPTKMEWRPVGGVWKDAYAPSRAKVVRKAGVALAGAALGATLTPVAPAVAPITPVAATRMSAVTGDPRGLFKFPVLTPKSKVIVKAEVADDLNRVWESHIAGEREVLAVLGPTGTAKTSLAFNLAAIHNIPIMTFDAVGAREFSDWVGTTHLRGDQTVFVPSGFLTAVDADGPYGGQFRIVLVDEVNRAESTGALNALIPMLHDYLSLYVPELNRAVAIDPAVMFVLTANRGSQYGGTIGLDAAFVDRVTSWVRMDYLEKDAEKDLVVARTGLDGQQADRLCLAAQRVREAAQRGELPEGGGISTRRILIAAGKAVRGMSLHRAASLAWMGSYPDEGGSTSESTVVKSAIDAVLRGL